MYVQLVRGEKRLTRRVDRAYIERSILQPDSEIVEGYRPGSMPLVPLEPHELSAVIAAVRHIGNERIELPWHYYGWLFALIAAALIFVGSHLLLSMHPLRHHLVRLVGEGGFQALYSLAGVGSLGALIFAWSRAPTIPLWETGLVGEIICLVGMPFAFLLLVCGLSATSPTAAGKGALVRADFVPQGILKVTRHPGLWGFALFGLVHLPPNGDLAALILFGSIALLALVGMAHIDRRRQRHYGVAWQRYAARTSLIPFRALVRRRERVTMAEIGWLKLALALALYGVVLLLHARMFGSSAFPG
jgi:uncharacterized membrane protein